MKASAGPSVSGTELYYAYPESSDFSSYKVFDNNNDGYTWESPGLYGMSYSGGAATLDADDWCILPAVTLDDTSVFYDFYCQARGAMDQNPEDFDVFIGTSPTVAGMTTKILEVRNLDYRRDMNDYDEFEKFFLIPSTGTYYIGFHAISPGSSCAFYVRNIYLLKTTIKSDSPQQVSNVSVQANTLGELNATVNFTLPVKDNLGNDYPASTSVTATVKSPAQTRTVSGAPGSQQSVQINTVEGENVITIVTSVNGNAGLVYTTSTNTGLDAPGMPLNVKGKVSEDNMKLTLTWDAPTKGANGGFINPDNLYYLIYKYSESAEKWTYIDYAYDKEYSYTVKPSAPQENAILGVAAVNLKDDVETPEAQYAIAQGIVGRPYSTPFVEEFKIGETPFSPVVKDVPGPEYDNTYLWFGDPRVGLGSYADLPGRKCYIAFSRQSGNVSYTRTIFPKISTQDLTEAQASFYIYVSDETPKTEFYINNVDGEETLLGTIDEDSGNGWTTFTYDIPEKYLGQRWVNYIIKAEHPDGWGTFMTIAGYELTKVMDHDLAVSSVTGESALSSEETGYYTAVVENRGRFDEQANIKAEVLDAEGNVLTTLTLMSNSDPLTIEAGGKNTYHYQYAPEDSHEGAVTLRVSVLNDNDERTDNNTADYVILVSKANRPEMDELKLTGTVGEPAVLTWGTPVIHFHDSFEEYESFSYPDYIGYWLNYDEDLRATYTLNGLSFPGAENAKAFQVMSVSESGIVGRHYQAPDGDKYIWAFCPYDNTAASDWFLSPMIKGGSDVSFSVATIGDFPEQLDVVYAVKESPALTDFRILDPLSLELTSDGEWETYSYTLPVNATYWGFHYISADALGVMIDEVDYKVDFPRDIDGFNVYKNGVKIASDLQGYSFTDEDAKDGDRYNMTVSYTNASKVKTEGWMSENLYFGNPAAGVASSAAVEKVKVTFTTVSGVKVENPDKGIYIRTTEYSDGTVRNDKIVIR